MTILRKNSGAFNDLQKSQRIDLRQMAGSCKTICQPYSVPGGGTPCGTKCMLYCAGKQPGAEKALANDHSFLTEQFNFNKRRKGVIMAKDCCKKPCLVLVSQDDDKSVYR